MYNVMYAPVVLIRHWHCSIRTDLYLLVCRRDGCGRCGSRGPRRHRPCQWTPPWQSPDRWLSGRGSSRTEDLPKTKHHNVRSAWLHGCYVYIYMYMYVADAERPTLWQSNLNARAPTSTVDQFGYVHHGNVDITMETVYTTYACACSRTCTCIWSRPIERRCMSTKIGLCHNYLIFVSIAFSKSSLSKYMTMTLCAWRNFRVLNYVTSACFVAVLLTLLW